MVPARADRPTEDPSVYEEVVADRPDVWFTGDGQPHAPHERHALEESCRRYMGLVAGGEDSHPWAFVMLDLLRAHIEGDERKVGDILSQRMWIVHRQKKGMPFREEANLLKDRAKRGQQFRQAELSAAFQRTTGDTPSPSPYSYAPKGKKGKAKASYSSPAQDEGSSSQQGGGSRGRP